MRIVVVTNNQLGWDCVCGAFKSFDVAVHILNEREGREENDLQTQEDYESDGYVFSEVNLEE